MYYGCLEAIKHPFILAAKYFLGMHVLYLLGSHETSIHIGCKVLFRNACIMAA